MPKYRLLNKEELITLEEDFVKYLVINGITADDWEKMKVEKAEEAEKIIDLFSDVVFEKILRQAKFIKRKTGHSYNCIQCNEDEMILLALNSKTENDFSNAELFRGKKKYDKIREQQIFEMLEEGYEISNGETFNKLKNIITE